MQLTLVQSSLVKKLIWFALKLQTQPTEQCVYVMVHSFKVVGSWLFITLSRENICCFVILPLVISTNKFNFSCYYKKKEEILCLSISYISPHYQCEKLKEAKMLLFLFSGVSGFNPRIKTKNKSQKCYH